MAKKDLAVLYEDSRSDIEELRSRTPFYYFSKDVIRKNLEAYTFRNFDLYYSVKACLFPGLIDVIKQDVEGFSASSLGEYHAIKNDTSKYVHFTSPMIREKELKELSSSTKITFNSLELLNRLMSHVEFDRTYIRVNPELSLVKDSRYDPCRHASRLGVPIPELLEFLISKPNLSLGGIHIHTASGSSNLNDLIKTLDKVKAGLGVHFSRIDNINVGGGYRLNGYQRNPGEGLKVLNSIRDKYDVSMTIEPGYDIVNNAGYLVTSVVDRFRRDGKNVLVLDTSVNHLPEVFEYGTAPHLDIQYGGFAHHPEEEFKYPSNDPKANPEHYAYLTGCTCLAGDVFGYYHLGDIPRVGDILAFSEVGAYSIVKCHTFNGIEKPGLLFTDDELRTPFL